MLDTVKEMLSYPFMQRAVVVGLLVSLSCALLGVSLVLKRYSMIGDGLSHVGFGAFTFAAVLGFTPLYFAMPVVVLAAFLMLKINEHTKVKGDAVIGLIASSSLAAGIIAVSISRGMNRDVYNYMFGSILAMNDEDLFISIIISVAVLLLYTFYYNRIFAITFDEKFSKAVGLKAEFFNFILATLTALTIVLGMRMMGALLISSLVIFPAVSAMRVFKSYKKVVVFSGLISVFSLLSGLYISYVMKLPTGASVVIINLIILILCTVYQKLRTLSGQ